MTFSRRALSGRPWFTRFVDVRPGEVRTAVQCFAALFLIIAGHTTLETARDALLLTRLPPRAFAALYIAAAVAVFAVASGAARVAERVGLRRSLSGTLAFAAALVTAISMIHMNRGTVVLVYVVSTLVGAVLVPQYWNLIGSLFTVAEGRRLLGPIAAAGVVGGATGSAAAATALTMTHVRMLLPLSATAFVVAAVVIAAMTPGQTTDKPSAVTSPHPFATTSVGKAMRDEPFLRHIMALVVVSTAAMFALDYLFKSTVARTVPHAEVARFVARYYAALNGVALVTQLLLGGAVVRRIGVAGTMLVAPFVLLSGAVGALAAGGALLAVLILKGVDGAIRTPLHRVVTELLYLPMPTSLRGRAKPYIDGTVARTSQAAVGAFLFVLASSSLYSPRVMAGVVVALGAAWLVVAFTTRRAYFQLLRRTVSADATGTDSGIDPLDFETAEGLVQSLADDDPLVVIGAIDALERRGRGRLVSALVLLHADESIVTRALDLFSSSRRTDWVTRARTLLTDPRDAVRMAAARALAMQDQLDTTDLTSDASPGVRGYAALHVALRSNPVDAWSNPEVTAILAEPGESGEHARLGLLSAIADLPTDSRVSRLLLALESRAGTSAAWAECLARAAVSQQATGMIALLVSRLSRIEGRETVLSTLVAFGEPALNEVEATLVDATREKKLRAQLPNALARFGTSEAAERILACIETERDGLIRYKAVRALGRIVSEHRLKLDRVRIERLAYGNLLEYFRLLGMRAKLEVVPPSPRASIRPAVSTERLVVGLLDDKIRQALERAFRLLKVAHPREDIHRVFIACMSDDKRARANAAEFLDALLRHRDQRPLRELLLLVADDNPVAEGLARATPLLERGPPKTREEALDLLLHDRDPALADLARLHEASLGHGAPLG